MQTVRVRLFARFRDVFGAEVIDVEVAERATVKELRDCLAVLKPEIAVLLVRSQIAVNSEFADDSTGISHMDEIAILPPVSGG